MAQNYIKVEEINKIIKSIDLTFAKKKEAIKTITIEPMLASSGKVSTDGMYIKVVTVSGQESYEQIDTSLFVTKISQWKPNYSYTLGDVVAYNHMLYQCIVDVSNETTWKQSQWTLIGSEESQYIIVDKYSKLPTKTYTNSMIALILEDETIDTEEYKKGTYLYDVATNKWNKYLNEDYIHTNIETLNKLSSDITKDDTGIVTSDKLKYNNDIIALLSDIESKEFYIYEINKKYKINNIVYKDLKLYVALQETTDLTQLNTENGDFKQLYELPNTINLFKYEAGKQYDKDTIILKDKDFYLCLTSPQVDENNFDNAEWELLSKRELETNNIDFNESFGKDPTTENYKGDSEKVVSSDYLNKQMIPIIKELRHELGQVFDLTKSITYNSVETKADLDKVDLSNLEKILIYLVKTDESREQKEGVYPSAIYIAMPTDDTTNTSFQFMGELNVSEAIMSARMKEAIEKALYIFTDEIPEHYTLSDDGTGLTIVSDDTEVGENQIKLSNVNAKKLPTDEHEYAVGEIVKLVPKVDSTNTGITKFVKRDEIDVNTVKDLSTITEQDEEGNEIYYLGFKGNKVAVKLEVEDTDIDFNTIL